MRTTITFCALFLAASAVGAGIEACPKGGQSGLELYSWPDTKGTWSFAILLHTSRSKSEAEIKVQSKCRLSVEEAEQVLSRLGAKDTVYWVERKAWGLPLPPPEVVHRLAARAKAAKVQFVVFNE